MTVPAGSSDSTKADPRIEAEVTIWIERYQREWDRARAAEDREAALSSTLSKLLALHAHGSLDTVSNLRDELLTWRARAVAAEAALAEVQAELKAEHGRSVEYRLTQPQLVVAQRTAQAQANAASVTLDKIRELHRPKEVKHMLRSMTVDEGRRLSDPEFRASLADEPYEMRLHCTVCECGQDDWPCATAALLGERQQPPSMMRTVDFDTEDDPRGTPVTFVKAPIDEFDW